jgi:hypothetical protein
LNADKEESVMRICRSIGLSLCLVAFFWPRQATATIMVSVGDYTATTGELVTARLQVSNSSAAALTDVEGMDFLLQIAGGTGTTPKITSIDLLSGTVWFGHVSVESLNPPDGGDEPQFQARNVWTLQPGDFVDANGLLATVTIDTTGAPAGDYALKLIGTKSPNPDSAFLNGMGETVAASFANGKVSVFVPEPMCIIPAGCVLALWLLQRSHGARRRSIACELK